MDSAELRGLADRAQRGAEAEQARISEPGVDPDYISRMERFEELSHTEIHSGVQAMRPAEMQAQAQEWVRVGDGLSGAAAGLHIVVQAALADGLHGRIADAAETAARRFVRDVLDIAEIAHSTGHRMTAAAYGAEATRKNVPPPLIHSFADFAAELHQAAIAAMEADYVPSYAAAGSGVPAFFPGREPGVAEIGPEDRPFDHTSDRGSDGGGGGAIVPGSGRSPADGSGWPGVSPDHAVSGASKTRETSAAVASADTGDTSSAAAEGTSGYRLTSERPSGRTEAPSDSGGPFDRTTPAGRSPALAISAGHTGPKDLGRQAFPHYSRGRAPAGRLPGTPSPDPGRSIPGEPVPGTGPAPALSRTPGGEAPPATAAAPGMFAPPARAGSTDSDRVHRSPDWLVRDRRLELLGPPPATVPAALGAEFVSARNDLADKGPSG